MKQGKNALTMLLYFLVIFSAFLVLMLLTAGHTTRLETATPGRLDATAFDFEGGVGVLQGGSFAQYPGQLLIPADFAGGELPAQAVEGSTNADPDFATYRLVVRFPADGVYGISAYSARYSQRLWIDGVEYEPIGSPGTTREETTPKTQYYAYYFPVQNGEAEIIIQRAGLVHWKPGRLSEIYIASAGQLTHWRDASQLRINWIVGAMLMSTLFFFGLFLFFPRRRQLLWFSLACLMVMLRTLTVDDLLVMTLLPNLSWYTAIRVEYLSFIGLILFLILYATHMYGGTLHPYMVRFAMGCCVAYALAVVALPPWLFGHVIVPFQYLTAGFCVYFLAQMVYSMVRHKKHRHPEHFMILLGMLALLVLGVPDIQLHQRGVVLPVNLTQMGMMLCVFANMLALALSFVRTEADLAKAQKSREETERLNRLKSEFMRDISHEMKTPLSVMSGFAQLTTQKLRRGASAEDVEPGLAVISSEADRLAGLVSGMLDATSLRELPLAPVATDIAALVEQVAGLYAPVLKKNGNRLEVNAAEALPLVLAKPDLVTQVLLNLLANAGRHTRQDTICIAISQEEAAVAVSVADTGPGIPPELLGTLFQRESKGSQGETGLGLSICREIVEDGGGRIWAENPPEGGAKITFTLPLEPTETEEANP